MKIQVSGEGPARRLYVFPDDRQPLPRHALAGPFKDRIEAAWWMISKLEGQLGPAKMARWAKSLAMAGGIDANPFQLLGLLGMIKRGSSDALIEKCSPAVREHGRIVQEFAPEYPVDVIEPVGVDGPQAAAAAAD